MKNKGFTLIEIIVVLVILAIILLIVAPIILDVTQDAEKTVNVRNVDGYGKAIENAIAVYKMENGRYAKSIDNLKIEYSGAKVKCNEIVLNKNGTVYLSHCYVNRSKVMNLDKPKLWYSYGKIEYDYRVGESVTYKNELYYVVHDSKTADSYVSLLKYNPLTVDEVNLYGGVGTENNHVNKNVTSDTNSSYYQKAYNYSNRGYGGMAYYSSEMCGYDSNGTRIEDDCKNDYNDSDVKYVVDGWANAILNMNDLDYDSLGYKVRLITYDEISKINYNHTSFQNIYYSNNYYWTMSTKKNNVYCVESSNYNYSSSVASYSCVVRPVINLKKEVIGG